MERAAAIGKNLTIGYSQGKAKKGVLKNLNFSLSFGKMTCLLGPNGVGKSTLIKAILGELSPWEGQMFLNGKAIASYSNEQLSKQLSVVLTQSVFPGNMTVGQLVALGRIPYTSWTGKLSDHDKQVVKNALEATKITYLKDERLTEISDGQRQKAMIARALAQDGPVMILDEPTAHLDLVNRFEIMGLLQEIAKTKDKAILVVTHDLEIALETADQIWLLNCGTPLISGLPEDLVISGQINQMLSSDKFRFNVERGKIESKISAVNIPITGAEELKPWLKSALIKARIYSLEFPIHISKEPFEISYQGQTSKSIAEFLDSIKSTP